MYVSCTNVSLQKEIQLYHSLLFWPPSAFKCYHIKAESIRRQRELAQTAAQARAQEAMSFAIFKIEHAIVFIAPLASTTALWAAVASNLLGAVKAYDAELAGH